LRYPYEVRKEDEYFNDIPDEKIPKDMLELASHIVETKTGRFDPKKFEDRYEHALKDLLKKKQKGEKIEKPKERAPSNVVNLMDALRQSVQAEKGAGSERRASKPRRARTAHSRRAPANKAAHSRSRKAS
jgi:DNA end-binding protein Ku